MLSDRELDDIRERRQLWLKGAEENLPTAVHILLSGSTANDVPILLEALAEARQSLMANRAGLEHALRNAAAAIELRKYVEVQNGALRAELATVTRERDEARQELPGWVIAVIRALSEYEESHPVLFAQYAGRSGYQPADCAWDILRLVPAQVVADVTGSRAEPDSVGRRAPETSGVITNPHGASEQYVAGVCDRGHAGMTCDEYDAALDAPVAAETGGEQVKRRCGLCGATNLGQQRCAGYCEGASDWIEVDGDDELADGKQWHGYTDHGHPCCGHARIDGRPGLVARCGGVGLCRRCQQSAAVIHIGDGEDAICKTCGEPWRNKRHQCDGGAA